MDLTTLAVAKKYTDKKIAEASTGEVDLSEYAKTSYVDEKVAGIVETDPTVPAWAKAETKPAYTAAEVGAVPTTRTVNNKALNANITLSAADVAAVPTTRTVNGKVLSANITLSASDVGALPSDTTIPSIDGLASETYVNDSVAALSTNFILNSSTEGSTKKFKITVDDAGTLTATEVVE